MAPESGTKVAPVHQPPSPAALPADTDWAPAMVYRERMLEDQLRAMQAERDFLRGVVTALVERRGPVRLT